MDMANAPDSNHARFRHRIQGQLILVLLVSLIPTLLIVARIFNEWYKARHESEFQFVKKGVTAKKQIEAGIKVIEAGMELSEYFMPGLGGKDLSEDHARESASVLNEINPHFIRLRTLRVPPRVPLFNDLRAGRFEKLSDQDEPINCLQHEAYMSTGIQRSSTTPSASWTTTTPVGQAGRGKPQPGKDFH